MTMSLVVSSDAVNETNADSTLGTILSMISDNDNQERLLGICALRLFAKEYPYRVEGFPLMLSPLLGKIVWRVLSCSVSSSGSASLANLFIILSRSCQGNSQCQCHRRLLSSKTFLHASCEESVTATSRSCTGGRCEEDHLLHARGERTHHNLGLYTNLTRLPIPTIAMHKGCTIRNY